MEPGSNRHEHTRFSDLAAELGCRQKNLRLKASELGLIVGSEVSPIEAKILRTIADWKRERIRGFREGLNGSDTATILRELEQVTREEPSPKSTRVDALEPHDAAKLIERELDLRVRPLEQRVTELGARLERLSREAQQVDGATLRQHVQADFTRLGQRLDTRLSSGLESGKAELDTLRESVDSMAAQVAEVMRTLEADLAPVRAVAGQLAATQEELARIRRRVAAVVDRCGKVDLSLPSLRPVQEIQQSLRADGFLFSRETIEEVCQGLEQGHVLFAGPPGTGKTTLLSRLPEFFDAGANRVHQDYLSVHPEWTSYDVIGGKKLFGTELGIHLGAFTELLFQAIEEGRPRILALDELNLAAPEDLLGGLLDYLESGVFRFADLKLVGANDGVLRGQHGVRVACAINETSREFRYRLPPQLRRRFQVVDLTAIDRDSEAALLHELTAQHRKGGFFQRITRRNAGAGRLIAAISALRAAGFDARAFGISHARRALHDALHSHDGDAAADRALAKHLAPGLAALGADDRSRASDLLAELELLESQARVARDDH